jgi:hypothetical protein
MSLKTTDVPALIKRSKFYTPKCPDCSVTLCTCGLCHTFHCDSRELCRLSAMVN